ncbi:MAG: hypothetical protein AB7K09_16545 [Planctomycetota bacterium]
MDTEAAAAEAGALARQRTIVLNLGPAGALACCAVVMQAAVPLGSFVAGSAYEGVIVAIARHDRQGAEFAWAPSEAQVREAEGRLAAFIGSGEASAVLRGTNIGAELANYKRQYWGTVANGRRQLLMSFIHQTSTLVEAGQWRTTAVLLEDGGYPSSNGVVIQGGGERYFRVTYSIESKRFSQLHVNSPI